MPGPAIDGRIAQVAGACLPTAMGVVNFYISETPVKRNFAGACAFEGEMVLEIDKNDNEYNSSVIEDRCKKTRFKKIKMK